MLLLNIFLRFTRFVWPLLLSSSGRSRTLAKVIQQNLYHHYSSWTSVAFGLYSWMFRAASLATLWEGHLFPQTSFSTLAAPFLGMTIWDPSFLQQDCPQLLSLGPPAVAAWFCCPLLATVRFFNLLSVGLCSLPKRLQFSFPNYHSSAACIGVSPPFLLRTGAGCGFGGVRPWCSFQVEFI